MGAKIPSDCRSHLGKRRSDRLFTRTNHLTLSTHRVRLAGSQVRFNNGSWVERLWHFGLTVDMHHENSYCILRRDENLR